MVIEAETEIVLDVNPYFLSCTGFAREDVVGKKLAEAEPFLDIPLASTLISSLTGSESIRHDEVALRKSDDGIISMELVANLYHVGSQPVAQLNLRDITQREEQEEGPAPVSRRESCIGSRNTWPGQTGGRSYI
ncbi:MAG: PAS domain S-box protein [Acidobacteriota bacterium]|nr:PAS domain S-box protein [Acidobacteriota bacterium]